MKRWSAPVSVVLAAASLLACSSDSEGNATGDHAGSAQGSLIVDGQQSDFDVGLETEVYHRTISARSVDKVLGAEFVFNNFEAPEATLGTFDLALDEGNLQVGFALKVGTTLYPINADSGTITVTQVPTFGDPRWTGTVDDARGRFSGEHEVVLTGTTFDVRFDSAELSSALQ